MSMLPSNLFTVFAATEEHPDFVTITVLDNSNAPLAEATVKYEINSVSGGNMISSNTVKTDEKGCVEILQKESFASDDLTLNATVSKSGYKDSKLENKTIESAEQNFEVTLEKLNTITDVTVENNSFDYDGDERDVAIVTGINNKTDKVICTVNGKEYNSIPKVKDVNTYDVTVTVTRDGFEPFTKSVTTVISKGKINIEVNTENYIYDGENHPAASVSGLKIGDVVTYSVNDVDSEPITITDTKVTGVPSIKNAGEYSLKVKVERENYETYENEYTGIKINAATIDGISLMVYDSLYDGKFHDSVKVTGDKPGDVIEYSTDKVNWSLNPPQIMDYQAGGYTVHVRITRDDNYDQYEESATANIRQLGQSISFKNYEDGKTTEFVFDEKNSENNKYDFSASGGIDESVFVYSLKSSDNSEGTTDLSKIAEIDSTTGEVTVNGPGCVTVVSEKPGMGNYANAVINHNLIIKAPDDGLISFTNSKVNYTFGENAGKLPQNELVKKYPPVENGEGDNGVVEYSVSGVNGLSIDRKTGEVKVDDYKALAADLDSFGSGEVVATVTANKGVGTKTTYVDEAVDAGKKENEYAVYFSDAKNWGKVFLYYWTNNGEAKAWPGTELSKTHTNDYGENVYRAFIPKDTKGIIYSNGNDVQTVDITNIYDNANYYPTIKFLGKYGVASVKWTKSKDKVPKTEEVYPEASATYTISIKYAPSPEETYEINNDSQYNVKGIIDGVETGWYISSVKVTPKDSNYIAFMQRYEDASIEDVPTENKGEAIFSNQGETDRFIYLRNNETGGITAPISVLENNKNLKIDTVAPTVPPDVGVTYSESVPDSIISVVSLGFYNPSVTMSFTASDETSKTYIVDWEYVREDDASETNVEEHKDTVRFGDDGVASTTLTADEEHQYRGHINYTVYDTAGNATTVFENDKVFAIDTINPKMSIGYSTPDNQEDDKTWYYGSKSNGKVDVRLVINEINFFAENINVSLIKDGKENAVTNVAWHNGSTHDEYYGDFSIGGTGDPKDDGVYQVVVKYQDYADNSFELEKEYNKDDDSTVEHHDKEVTKNGFYKSMPLVIDTIAPEIEFDYQNESAALQYTTVKINEVNFDPKDITISKNEGKDYICYYNDGSEVNGVSEESITEIYRDKEKWSDNNTLKYSDYTEGIYDYIIHYTDLANNEATSKSTGEFKIDHTAPHHFEIKFSEDNRVTETILNNLTFNYYRYDQKVKVTFTATDEVSGVERFDWVYDKYKDASEKNQKHLEGVLSQSKNEIKKDGQKFTAEVVIPANDAHQLMGYVSVKATDNYENTPKQYFNNRDEGIVVDTVNPRVHVTFDPCSNPKEEEDKPKDSERFYGLNVNGQAGFTVSVNEANFFEKDIKVSLSKNGGVAKSINLSWKNEGDLHYGRYVIGTKDNVTTHKDDGHYIVYISYKDHSQNVMNVYDNKELTNPLKDSSGKNVTEYKSQTITIDTINPVIDVKYHNEKKLETLTDRENHKRDYFDTTQKATVTITEHNFDAGNLTSKTAWSNKGDVHTITITFSGDANYNFDLDYTDLAKNKAADYKPDYFTVDTKAPVITNVSYSTSILETVINNLSYGFYNASMEVTVTATDETAGVHGFVYNYRNAAGVSGVNAELINQAIEEGSISYSADGRTATLRFNIPKDALGSNNQFNGTVDFTSTDRSHNEVKQQEDKRIVVDNISPTCSVTYNTPVNETGGVSYYDGNINGTITINEANFDSQDVSVTYSMNGSDAGTLPVSWSDNSVDEHIGTFTLTSDGDYIVRISYTDKSSNSMETYTSNQMTIDTKIEKPRFAINGTAKENESGAYKDNVSVNFSYDDQNFDSQDISLIRTNFSKKDGDIKSEFIKEINSTEKGGSGSFDIPKKEENDGIYILKISMVDKAKHTTSSYIKFTVNRYGSVYEYSDYLMGLIKDGGQYIKKEDGNDSAITDDLIITEYNADKIVKDSLNILITRDGEPVAAQYTTNPNKIDNNATVGDSGWFEYVYTISKENFAQDGVYKISLSSKDDTKNDSISVPDNSVYDRESDNPTDKKKSNPDKPTTYTFKNVKDSMQFTVDTTAPDISNIANLDQQIIDAQEVDVKYSLVDIGGLSSVEVYVDGETVDSITDFSKNRNDYSGEFTINEKNEAQTVRIKVTDLAGNVTDTKSEEFSSGDKYVFFDTVTVSTNFFVRWFANKPLFFGSIAGAVVVLGGAGAIIGLRIRKKKKS